MGSGPRGPDAPRPLYTDPLCPISNQGSPEALLKLQMAPQAYTLNILRLQKGAQMRMSE
jgi:hypothetical protein